MEVSRGCVYLYEFTNYDRFTADIELLMDINHEFDFTLLSRLPTRRLIEKLDLSKVSNYWVTDKKSSNSIRPDIAEISSLITADKTTLNCFFILDGLELIATETDLDELIRSLSSLFDHIKAQGIVLAICIDTLAFDSEWIVKLQYLTEKLVVKSPDSVSVEEESSTNEESNDIPYQHELGIDGGPRLAYLAKLPEQGFTREILVKRILQWRRMGLDVSAIEPALAYDNHHAYQLYKLVEEDVRRATELERFIHENHGALDASQIAVDMFRVRQLTGLDELEKKYYSSS